MKIKLCFLLCIIAFFYSCDTDEINSSIYNEDNISEFIKLKGEDLFNNAMFNKDGNDGINLIIFSVQIHRPKKKCLSGLGFCDFKWFPTLLEYEQNVGSDETYKIVEIKMDVDGSYYFEIELQNAVPKDVPNDLTYLIVENDLNTGFIPEYNRDFNIKANSYALDTSIGNEGGYRIPLE